MKKHLFLLIVALFSSNVFSQEFKLTNVGNDAAITVDRFSNEIYISPWTQSLVGKYEFISNSAHSTDFEGLPVFMHNSYKSINMEITDTSNAYYIRDFESGSKRKLFEIIFGKTLLKAFNYNMPYHTISQNDKYLFNYSVFVIDDSLWLRSHFQIFGEGYPYSWSSDSSVVYLSQDNAIAEYNIFTKTIDTLVSHSEGDIILNLDYNIKEDLLAYTIENKFYIFDNKSKTSIFEFETSTMGWVEIYDLKWNEDETKIAFLGYDYTNPISVIYIYETDSNKVFVAQNSGYGLKTSLQWLNNDTLLYIADNDLYGYDISGITDVDDNLSSLPNKFILEQNYPNPFNPSTVIKYSIPTDMKSEMSNVKLVVFDILGREVITLVNETKKAGKYEVTFDALNLTSGIYFFTLQSGKYKESKKMILLK
jgi:hypothetical protein